MDRVYSIEETRARLGGISRTGPYAMLRAGIGCRRFVSVEAIAALVRNSTTSVSPSQDAVRSWRPLVNAGPALTSNDRVVLRCRKSDAE